MHRLLIMVSASLSGRNLEGHPPVPDMTYNVFSGTLSPTQSINQWKDIRQHKNVPLIRRDPVLEQAEIEDPRVHLQE